MKKGRYRCFVSVLCAALLLVAAAPTASAAMPAEAAAVCSDTSWEVLKLTNRERMAEGILPLSVFPELQQAADIRAVELGELFSHTRPDGSSCYTALTEQGLAYSSTAENIASGYASPQAVVTGWMNSEGHRANILNDKLCHVGVGYDSSNWVQLFLNYYCSFTTMEVVPGTRGYTLAAGKTIDDLDAAVKLTCARHGTCWMPLIQEMCGEVDTSQVGSCSVTVSYGGLSCSFTIQIVENTDGTYTEGDFTAEVENGEATITSWNGSSSWQNPVDVTVPGTIAGFPVVKIGEGVFANTYLSSVSLPNGLEEIGENAFFKCSVPSISLPDSLRKIEGFAFAQSGLSGTLHIPASVTFIGTYALSYLHDLSAFAVESENGQYCSEDGVLFNKTKTTLLNYPLAKTAASYVVPSSVTLLYCTSFAWTDYLTDLYLYSPTVRAMTYTFYGDGFAVWCRPETSLYTQLSSGALSTSVTCKELPCRVVSASEEEISITLADQFTGGTYLLAAYTEQGRMLAVRVVSGEEAATYTLPGTSVTASVRLFRLDEAFAPTAEGETVWPQ